MLNAFSDDLFGSSGGLPDGKGGTSTTSFVSEEARDERASQATVVYIYIVSRVHGSNRHGIN